MAVIGVALVPMFQNAQNIINLLQQLNGLTSMAILAAFIVGLLFKRVSAEAASLAILFGAAFYGWLSLAPKTARRRRFPPGVRFGRPSA